MVAKRNCMGTFMQKSQTALLVSLGNGVSSRKLHRIVAILTVPNSLSISRQQKNQVTQYI